MRPGKVKMFNLHEIVASDPQRGSSWTQFVNLLKLFPGPLSTSSDPDKIIRYLEGQIQQTSPHNHHLADLMRMIQILVKQNGHLVVLEEGPDSPGSSYGSPSSKNPLLELLLADSSTGSFVNPDQETSVGEVLTSYGRAEGLREVERLVAQGRREAACRLCVEKKLWTEALVLCDAGVCHVFPTCLFSG